MDSWYRIVVLGAGGVGKTALVQIFISGSFVEDYDPTIEDDYRKQIMVDDEVCLLDLLDTAGEEEYSAMRDQWMRCGEGFLILFSINSYSSFEDIRTLVQQLARVKDVEGFDELDFVLVASKCDLFEDQQIPRDEIISLAAEFHATAYVETSSKRKWNIDEGFYEIVRAIRRRQARKELKPSRPKSKWSRLNPLKWRWDRKKKKLMSSSQKSPSNSPSSPTISISMRRDPIEDEVEGDFTPLEMAPSAVWDDLLAIFNQEGTAGDVLIKTNDGKSIICHKLILSIRSPTFARMFSHPSVQKNKSSDPVTIDLSHHQCVPALVSLLRFCYKPILLPQDEEFIDELKKLDTKYSVTDLQTALVTKGKDDTQSPLESSTAIQLQMAQSLKSYLHLSDCTFFVGHKHFCLHKCLLFARCHWFKGLLAGGFAEGLDKEIGIDSMDNQTFGHVIEYLYTGRIADIPPDDAFELMAAANMLSLKRLTHICEKALQPLLDAENVIAVYQAADFHNAGQLIDSCIHVIVKEYDTVSKLPEFLEELPASVIAMVKEKHDKYIAARTDREKREEYLKELRSRIPTFLIPEPESLR